MILLLSSAVLVGLILFLLHSAMMLQEYHIYFRSVQSDLNLTRNIFIPESLSDNNNQSVNDRPVDYAYDFDNIYFSVKTTESNYKERLRLLMMTWFQVVNNKVSSCV